MSFKQSAIALDQIFNTLVWSKYDGGLGMADETLSARAWRLHSKSRNWNIFKIFVDYLFLAFGEKNHCKEAWISENKRKHLPKEYI